LHATRTSEGSWIAGKKGDLLCATDPLPEIVQTFGEYGGRGKLRIG
jgi:G6PDH family F420-dependent oxidoreductase